MRADWGGDAVDPASGTGLADGPLAQAWNRFTQPVT